MSRSAHTGRGKQPVPHGSRGGVWNRPPRRILIYTHWKGRPLTPAGVYDCGAAKRVHGLEYEDVAGFLRTHYRAQVTRRDADTAQAILTRTPGPRAYDAAKALFEVGQRTLSKGGRC